MKFANLIIAFCWVFTGCGDSEKEPENEFVPSTSLVQSIATAQCDHVFDCCDTDELKIVLGGMDTIDKKTCVKNLKKQLGAFFGPSVEEAQKKDRISIDPSKIDSCAEAIRTQTCEKISADITQVQRFEACRNAIIAEQETAGFCDNNYECKSQFCVTGDDGGSCKNIPEVTQVCESSRCARGQFCDETNICRALGKDGEDCLNNASCESERCSIETNTCEKLTELCNE